MPLSSKEYMCIQSLQEYVIYEFQDLVLDPQTCIQKKLLRNKTSADPGSICRERLSFVSYEGGKFSHDEILPFIVYV